MRTHHSVLEPSALPFVAAGIVTMFAGSAASGVTLYTFLQELQSNAQSFPAEVGTYVVEIDAPGAYTIFNQRPPGHPPYAFDATVRFEGLDEQLLRPTSWDTTYSTDDLEGNGVAEFEAVTAGRYLLEVTDVSPRHADYRIVLTRLEGGDVFGRVLSAIGLAGAGFVAGVGLTIMGLNRSRRVR